LADTVDSAAAEIDGLADAIAAGNTILPILKGSCRLGQPRLEKPSTTGWAWINTYWW